MAFDESTGLTLEATELRLGLPGIEENEKGDVSCVRSNKRPLLNDDGDRSRNGETEPSAKKQIVGWPPVRAYRRSNGQVAKKSDGEYRSGLYVKVSMDGAPYLRKLDLKIYKGYSELLVALGNMFNFSIGEYSEREGYRGMGYVPTYEDKEGDWMLVGDVPWEMFNSSCKRLRIMKESDQSMLPSCHV